MTARLSLVFLVLTAAAHAAQPYHANLRFANIPDGVKPAAFTSDAAGNFYIVSNITEPSGRPQLRVDKIDRNGNPLANFEFGGSGWEYVSGAAIDSAGNLVIVGSTTSPDFPLVSPLLSTPELPAGFITKINAQLTNILFSTELGGTQDETLIQAVTLDHTGNIFVTGATYDSDFPITPSAFQKTPPQSGALGPAQYAFVTAISSNGKALLLSTYFGDSAFSCPNQAFCATPTTSGTAIVLDSTGNVIIAGSTSAEELPVTSNTFGMSCGGCGESGEAGFFAKFSADGSTLLWATFLPVVSNSEFFASIQITTLDLDAAGNIVAGGSTSSKLPVTSGALQRSFPAPTFSLSEASLGFVMKFDSSAGQILFCTYFGGGAGALAGLSISLVPVTFGFPGIQALVVDTQGQIWLTGLSSPGELPTVPGTVVSGQNYLAALSTDGSILSNIFTAPSGIAGLGIALTATGPTALGSTGALLTAESGQSPSLTAIVNSAGSIATGRMAPFELISLYGLGIGPQTPSDAHVVNGMVGTTLSGVQVLFDGIPAPLLYAGPTQINAVVPGEIYGHNTTTIELVTPTGGVAGPSMQVRPSQPGVVLSSIPVTGPFVSIAPPGAALNEDGSVNSAANPAALGSMVSVWVSGAGLSNYRQADGAIITVAGQLVLPVTASSKSEFALIGLVQGALSLEVDYAGDAVGTVAGVTQVNFRLPSDSGLGSQNIAFSIQIGSVSSEWFTLYLK